MHDGRTRKVESSNPDRRSEFLARHRATLILMSGDDAGKEWSLEGARSVAGRSEKAAIQLEDGSISSEHAAFELGVEGFGIRDLASTNGVRVNGQERLNCRLLHGDRIRLGDFELQYVVEDRAETPKAWSAEEEA